MANKRLIPVTINACGNNRYAVKVDEQDTFYIDAEETNVRRAILRMKSKNGDGKSHKKSSKNGTYKSMIGNQFYVWKSKCPMTREEFQPLLEKIDKFYAEERFHEQYNR